MVLPIVRYPEPVLRAKCRPVSQVTPEIRKLADDMIETMRDANGVGLAAPQVAVDVQLAVIDCSHNPECITFLKVNGQPAEMVKHMPVVFMNPQLQLGNAKETGEEGCLSVPGLRGDIAVIWGTDARYGEEAAAIVEAAHGAGLAQPLVEVVERGPVVAATETDVAVLKEETGRLVVVGPETLRFGLATRDFQSPLLEFAGVNAQHELARKIVPVDLPAVVFGDRPQGAQFIEALAYLLVTLQKTAGDDKIV